MRDVDVVVTRRIPQPGLDVLRAAGASFAVLEDDGERSPERDRVVAGARCCRVLLSLLTEAVDRHVLGSNELLRGVANMAAGYDNVDVEVATELGIPVTNTPGVLTETTADLTFALMLALARRVPESHRYMVAGRYRVWGPNLLLGADVGPGFGGRRKVLGVVGFGRIGAAVARRAAGFDMDVLACSPSCELPLPAGVRARWVDLDELLEHSDFVSLHAPLTPATRHLIGAAELARMKPTAFLINTARGPLVDEAELVRSLRRGGIAGAGLDVYEREPVMADGLAALPNVVLLPHIGSASVETRGEMARMAAVNAVQHLRGERAPNVVNPEVYDSAAWVARRRERS